MRPLLGLALGAGLANACVIDTGSCPPPPRVLLVDHTVTSGTLDALAGEVVHVGDDAVSLAYTLDGVRYEVTLAVTGGVLHDSNGTPVLLGGG